MATCCIYAGTIPISAQPWKQINTPFQKYSVSPLISHVLKYSTYPETNEQFLLKYSMINSHLQQAKATLLIFSFSLLSSHQAHNRTPKYKQLLVKQSMALLFINIFKKVIHTAPKKLHLLFQRQQTRWVGYFRLIY